MAQAESQTTEKSTAFDLEGLYRTTYEAVVRFLRRKVWDADRAEDLAQEVFLRALAHQPEKPRPWVFAVAANIARDEARAAFQHRKRGIVLAHDPSAAPSPNDDVIVAMEHAEQQEEVQRALAMLTPRDREVLLLWDAGLSYTEIAERTQLAMPPSPTPAPRLTLYGAPRGGGAPRPVSRSSTTLRCRLSGIPPIRQLPALMEWITLS
jgi:RNA polymerase sigma factor (sigma-70 family)